MDTFKSHFALSMTHVESLIRKINGHPIMIKKNNGGRPMIPPEKQLLIFLWYARNLGTTRAIFDRFDITGSACQRTIKRISLAIKESVTPEEILWPSNHAKAEETIPSLISSAFRVIKGLNGVIGAIDGTHLGVESNFEKSCYINRKGWASIVLQAVCDSKLLFTDCYV